MRFITSIIPTIMFIHTGQEIIISNWHWLTIQTLKLSLSFKIDYFSMIFVPVALFVTWSIIEFPHDIYTQTPTLINSSNIYLFLITILILVIINNLFQLYSLVEKELELYSFLLIGWWYGRADANTAALQAIVQPHWRYWVYPGNSMILS